MSGSSEVEAEVREKNGGECPNCEKSEKCKMCMECKGLKCCEDCEESRDCKNCEESRDCKNCEDCEDCTDCKNCEDCTDCKNCEDCEDCTDCKNCEECRECKGCMNCEECELCEDCTDCRNCKNHKKCTRCAECKECGECEDCTDCRNCEQCRECKGCEDCKECGECEDCTECKNCERRTGCRGHDKNGNEEQQAGNSNENKEVEKIPTDKILFDSMVSNEKEYLGKILRSQMLEEHEASENACVQFFNWLFEQFERIRTATPSPTLIYNLEFLCKMTHTMHLFEQSGNGSKTEVYLKRIRDGAEENYEAEDFDVVSLADASRKYIEQSLVFFDSHTTKKLNQIYGTESDPARKQFFMERLPYAMKNRSVFKLIRELIMKMNKDTSRSETDIGKPISVWSEAVIDHQITKEKRDEILNDLVGQEFDYVPLRFYD